MNCPIKNHYTQPKIEWPVCRIHSQNAKYHMTIHLHLSNTRKNTWKLVARTIYFHWIFFFYLGPKKSKWIFLFMSVDNIREEISRKKKRWTPIIFTPCHVSYEWFESKICLTFIRCEFRCNFIKSPSKWRGYMMSFTLFHSMMNDKFSWFTWVCVRLSLCEFDAIPLCSIESY